MSAADPLLPGDGGATDGRESSARPEHPDVDGALATLEAVTATLAALVDGDIEGREATAVAASVAAATSRLGVITTRLLAVIEADGLWAVGGARSFATWVARTHHVSIGTARAQVALARALRDDLPATATAATAGEIGLEHAQVMAKLGPTTPARRQALADPDNACNERFLVAEARTTPVDWFATLLRHWAAAADPDADDRGYVEASDREHFELSRMSDGYHVTGLLTIEHGQQLLTALRAITPVPPARDQRSSSQRRAQAVSDLARLAIDHGLTGTGRAVRPRLTVHVGYHDLLALAAQVSPTAGTPPLFGGQPGTRRTTIATTIDPVDTAAVGDALRSGPQFDDGTPVPRVLLDRLACDSEINRIVFGPDSEVLDVGRAERTFLGPLRAAIIARDRHCRFPHCTAPPAISECHHVRHWSRDHGTTSVDNGVLVCWFHHDYIHRRGVDIHRDNGTWTFTDSRGMTL